MRKNLYRFVALLAGLLSLASGNVPGAEDIRQAAREALPAMLETIPPGRELGYGFTDRAEFRRATVGEPFRLCTLALPPPQPGGPVEETVFQPLNEWRIPVRVDGRSRLLLTVIPAGSGWEVVGLGGATLARELQAAEETLALGQSETHRFLVRLFPLRCDWFLASAAEAPTETSPVLPLFQAADISQVADKTAQGPLTLGELERLPAVRDALAAAARGRQ